MGGNSSLGSNQLYDMDKSLGLGREDLHKPFIKHAFESYLGEKQKSVEVTLVSELGFGNVAHRDYAVKVVMADGRVFTARVECKTDYWTHITGNMCIELVSCLPLGALPPDLCEKLSKIDKKARVPGSPGGEFLLDIVEKVRAGTLKGTLGFGLMPPEKLYAKHYFSYLVAEEVPGGAVLHRAVLLRGYPLNAAFRENYRKLSICATNPTEGSDGSLWRPIASLFNLECYLSRKDSFFIPPIHLGGVRDSDYLQDPARYLENKKEQV